MPIRPPAGAEIRPLVAALDSDDAVARESAVARLSLIAPRGIDALLHSYASASPRARAGILRALEPAASPRALPIAQEALDSADPDVQLAAVAALRGLMTSETSGVSRDALDALVTRAMDSSQTAALRAAAAEALRDAPADVQAALGTMGAAAGGDLPGQAASDVWTDMVDGRLPVSPDVVKQAVTERRSTARLIELQHLVDHLRRTEMQEKDPARREDWRIARGAVHQALAARNSRLALYDLRDSLLEAGRLPVAFLAALEEIGDASCIETLAAAYDASSRSGDAWWREHLAVAFRAIVRREGLTRRHAAIKRAMARWPSATSELLLILHP
jgi:HEAT repeats